MASSSIIGILCGGLFLLIFIGLGIWLVIKSIQDKKKAGESQNWPSTLGTITQSQVSESVSTSDDDLPSYHPSVKYSYAVGGESFESNKIYFGAVSSGSQKKAQEVIARYSQGSTVTVFYNPINPKEAVLERQSKSTTVMLVLGIVFVLMAVCILCVGVFSVASQYLQ